jgi:GNAT superfamily N-acetyltransferase
LLTPTTPYRRELNDGLVLKSLAGTEDVERLAGFQGQVHGPGVADMTRELILNHPHTRSEYWLYVEDERTGEVVSSLCLIPWKIRYEDITLKAGEMGIVATLEAYRHRGLVRAQAARHAELLRENGFDLSHIQGIPYFYRQFGYEYAMPLIGGWHVELRQIPDAPDAAPGKVRPYAFRQATLDDLPLLMQFYDQAATDLAIHTVRDEAEWRYLFGPSMRTEMVAETWLVSQGRAPIGYLRIPHHGFGEGLVVNECSRLAVDAALAALRHLKSLSVDRSKPYIRLCLPQDSTLVQAARYRGAHDQGYYAWQIKLVDVGQLLRRLAPALERRIAASPFAGLTRDVCLNLYHEAFEMRFRAGKLSKVVPLGFSDRGGIRVPPLLLAPLVLGYRSREELAQAHHDFSVWGEWQHLVDVMFPKMPSFLYTIY